ncbi:MAG TPA: hypothetical protein VKB90_04125 [Candidatus Acidoferrum sp.]|nr:hypothetical protein [Candidatus Acidoferrum sp.]
MLRSKLLWAIILGIATSVLLIEAKIHLGYNPWETRIQGALVWPGAHLVTALNTEGTLFQGWTRFWVGLSFACNLLVYAFVWYVCLWILGALIHRQQPYDGGDNSFVPPITR